MPLNLLDHCAFNGPALPEPFVRFELEKELTRLDLLPKTVGNEGKKLQLSWDVYRRKLRELDIRGGPLRVRHCVLDPLVERLGFASSESAPEVETREGREEGGYVLISADGSTRLRTWTTEFDEDLDAPARRGAAYRFSHLRIAQRVLLASGERVGLLTNGVQLRLLISDPARPDSEVVIPLESGWKRSRDVPDSFRFLLALCQPAGIAAVPELVEKARLQQARVTKDLRLQAREAVERFVQEVLDHPSNAAELQNHPDRTKLARDLWHEGLVLVYRLLFILKLESTDDPARSFSFTSSSLWRNTFSPGVALATRVRDLLDAGQETGRYLEDALRNLFRMFAAGLECSELHIKPLGGALFGPEAAPLLDRQFEWGERAVAYLLDRLLWTQRKRGEATRQRVHYGALDVEDLGRVYEALLELDAGLSTERLCRLRRQKLEVVVPAAQGETYRPVSAPVVRELTEDDTDENGADEPEDETAGSGKKTKIEWIEEIPAHRFFLRVGLGRKATGSYYTPHSFVRFLVQETLGPLCAARSPQSDPNPGEILKLKVLDPAMGSGHFLVEACRFLAEKLYEACRLCDERADPAERRAENATDEKVKADAIAEATKWRGRVVDLPDPNDEILQYLPSRSPEGTESGISQRRALALCRRLVAVHCLYGVDKNRLAVELAKLSLWIESHGEGLPLTFLDHRLIEGDSLIGPFFEHLLTYPNSGEPLEGLFAEGLREKLINTLADALRHVSDLESTVGTTLSETEFKKAAKQRLDGALHPFRAISASWAGRVIRGREASVDYAYTVGRALSGDPEIDSVAEPSALPYEFAFPEVFFPHADNARRSGFDAVVGNPPWDKIRAEARAFLAAASPEYLEKSPKTEREVARALSEVEPRLREAWEATVLGVRGLRNIWNRFAAFDPAIRRIVEAGGNWDAYRFFISRSARLLSSRGRLGFVIAGGFAKNPADSEVRRDILGRFDCEWLIHFVNTKRIFDSLPPVIEFCLCVVKAPNQPGKLEARVGFDLVSAPSLQNPEGDHDWTIKSCQDLRHQVMEDGLAVQQFGNIESARPNALEWLTGLGLVLQDELNRTTDNDLFVEPPGLDDTRSPDVVPRLLSSGLAAAYAGRNFYQFDDLPLEKRGRWSPLSQDAVRITDRRTRFIRERFRFYRLAVRKTCGSPKTNSRSAIAAILRPGCTAANSVLLEASPRTRPTKNALLAAALLNSFAFDRLVRPHIQANLNQSILQLVTVPKLAMVEKFLVHQSLRLVCNHEGFRDLWAEQLGSAWDEPNRPPFEFPIFQTIEDRYDAMATVDALVAHAYGYSRDAYEALLAEFSHPLYSDTPKLFLDRFTELSTVGAACFTERHNPYAAIPLKETNPEPAFADFEGLDEEDQRTDAFSLSSPSAPTRKGRR